MNAPAPKPTIQIDTRESLVREAHVFRRAQWRCVDLSIEPIPDTWCPVHPEGDESRVAVMRVLKRGGAFALVSCPKCKQPQSLIQGVHKYDSLGKLSPAFICANTCGFHRVAYLDRIHQKPLYAIAIEGANGPEIVHTHARDVIEARRQLGPSFKGKIVGIAPAIGIHVDEKGVGHT